MTTQSQMSLMLFVLLLNKIEGMREYPKEIFYVFHFKFNVSHNFYLERKIENIIKKKKILVRGPKFVSLSEEGIIETSAGMIFYADSDFSSFSLRFKHCTLINMWFYETTRIYAHADEFFLKNTVEHWKLATSYTT